MRGTRKAPPTPAISGVIDRAMTEALLQVAQNYAKNLIRDAVVKKKFFDVTGNTVASYSAGVYLDRVLVDVYQAGGDLLKMPIMQTLKKGERFPYDRYYQDLPVKGKAFKAQTGMESYNAVERAFQWLESHKPQRKGVVICLCTGTEYSTYLEKIKHLDVMTAVAEQSNLQKILDRG